MRSRRGCGELGVPDVARRDTLYLAGDVLDADGLAREHEARRAAGFAGRLLRPARIANAISASGRPAAILGYGDLAIDPRKTTLRACCARPASTARESMRRSRSSISMPRQSRRDGDGGQRPAHPLPAIWCSPPATNCRTACRSAGHKIISTWAIATVPQPRRLWPEQCMIWEASDPYLYLRTTPDGRVICGGEDEEFSDEEKRDALLARKTSDAAAQARRSCCRSIDTTRRLRLDRIVRPERDRAADHRRRSRACRTAGRRSATAATAHLFADRGRRHRRRAHRAAGRRCRPVRLSAEQREPRLSRPP